MTAVNSLIVNEVLRVHGPDAQRLGVDRLDEDALDPDSRGGQRGYSRSGWITQRAPFCS